MKPYLGGITMELRHLRYFVAVAEEGSFTRAAEKRLHTAQPSLSRQIRDLEDTLKVRLIDRGPRGMSVTPAGQVFLEHARMILVQTDAAIDAARRAAVPARARFVIGFLTGHEIGWLPRVLRVLGAEIEKIELIVHSGPSPELIQALSREAVDLAFVRPDVTATSLAFHPLVEEELFVLMPADHKLARRRTIAPEALRGQAFINFSSSYSPALRHVIDVWLERSGITPVPLHEAETLPMVISFALSTGGVTLLPEYMGRLLPASVVRRPLSGTPPTVPLALGYNPSNSSLVLRHVLARLDALADPTT
jgi:LysR family transcriptional regulator, hca operon transcriptional activator